MSKDYRHLAESTLPGFVFNWTWGKGVVLPWGGHLRRFEERPTYRER